MNKVLTYGMTDNPGGIETYLINTMKELKKNDIQLDFLCDFPRIAHQNEIVANHSDVYFIPAKGKKLVQHWKSIFLILKQHPEYKVVYFNILDAGAAFTMVIPWLMGRKIVTHSHNGETDKKRLHKFSRPFLNIMTSNYLACSKVAARHMYGKHIVDHKKIELIPNAIDVQKYRFDNKKRNIKREELGIEDDKIVICHVGRISMQKNPYGMLDIFCSVLQKEENAVLLYVGTGELEQDIIDYSKKIKIYDYIRFLGRRNDVADLMNASDVFLLPSFYEGLPIVVIEAQASGLPCVISDLITDEVNITGEVKFVSLDDKKQWVDSIIEMARGTRLTKEAIFEQSDFNIKNYDKVIDRIRRALCVEEQND